MRLRKVEIFGFKTFPEKTILSFQPGITCIVGPNGCGKSNVVDAVLWAMGEQSTKTLRGERMEDVIFFGSESRKTISMSEVTLTIGDIKGELPSQYSGYSEVEITRRLFRSGESEYLINKVHCRLKDIKDILIDAGVGFKGHTVIEQGKVERILTSTPEDRRAIIEDTAGIMKFKYRKTEALRKLEATQHNLLRVRDIISEVKRQINSLDRQVRKAREYQELAGRIKEQEIALYAAKYTSIESTLKDLLSREDVLRVREIKTLSEVSNMEAETEETRRLIGEDNRILNGLRQSLFSFDREISENENKLVLLDSQVTHQKGEKERLLSEISKLRENLQTLNVTSESFRIEKDIIEEALIRAEAAILEEEKQFESASREFYNLQESLENTRTRVFGTVGKITEARNRETSIQARITELNRLKERGLAEKAGSATQLAETQAQILSRKEGKGVVSYGLEEKTALMTSLTDKLASTENSLIESTGRLDRIKEAFHRSEARYHSLEEMEKNLEGYQEGVKSILLSKGGDTSPLAGIHGIVADFLDIITPAPNIPNRDNIEGELQAEKVIEAVLGERLQNIVVEGQEDTKKAIEFLKSNSAGRTTFIPKIPRPEKHRIGGKSSQEFSSENALSNPPIPPLEKGGMGGLHVSGVIGPAMTFIEFREGYEALAEYFFSDVVIVDKLETAINLLKETNSSYTFVTIDGEVVESSGRITGGISNGKSPGLIQKRRELRALKNELLRLEREVSGTEGEVERAKNEKVLLQVQIENINKQIHEETIRIVNIDKDIEALIDDEKRIQLRIETLCLEERGIDSEISNLSSELNIYNEEIQRLLAEQAEGEQEIQGLIESQKLGREHWEEAQRGITTRKLELATRREKRESLSVRLKELGERIESATTLTTDKEESLSKIDQKIDGYLREKSGIESTIAGLWQKKDAISKEIVAKENERAGREERQRLSEEELKEKRRVMEDIKKEINQFEIQKAEIRLETGHLKETIYTTYQINLEEEIKNLNLKDLNIDELTSSLTALKERLNRMGPVNLASIEEYQELNQRYEFLTSQESDLTQACETLHKTISKINMTTREMFLNTFNIINEKFQYLFQLFFQGGESKLVLTDENNVLDSGIEIFAQPPGKKVSQLALLSGGEKALTAISLIFATFLARPTPFCVLDEIDAPLDEVNTERFINSVKDMTGFSQFIIITHNKRTMEAADTLYGITMEDPGVSKIVSVNLTKREQHPLSVREEQFAISNQ